MLLLEVITLMLGNEALPQETSSSISVLGSAPDFTPGLHRFAVLTAIATLGLLGPAAW